MIDVGAYGIRPVSRMGNGERRSASIPRVGLRPTLRIARPAALPKDRRSFLISMGHRPMGGGERRTEKGERIPLLWRGRLIPLHLGEGRGGAASPPLEGCPKGGVVAR
jgi:hypothetical protein